jgi:hypothetical protein
MGYLARKQKERQARGLPLSGRRDLNPGPLQPHCSALAKLRHAPYGEDYNKECAVWQIEMEPHRHKQAGRTALNRPATPQAVLGHHTGQPRTGSYRSVRSRRFCTPCRSVVQSFTEEDTYGQESR